MNFVFGEGAAKSLFKDIGNVVLGEGAGRSLFRDPGNFVFAGGWHALFRPALPRTAPPLQILTLRDMRRTHEA